tara:strand:+ start:9974 stop:10393 length:420 start_codon:yes stop_codon:yes gene_type:complete
LKLRKNNFSTLKIVYKKKQIKLNLILGITWFAVGLIGVFRHEEPKWIDYFYLVISFLYFALYFYHKNGHYVRFENGVIKQNWPYGKSLPLSEIKTIRHFAGEYTLKTEKKKLTINIDLIDEDSLLKLKNELKKLSAEWI